MVRRRRDLKDRQIWMSVATCWNFVSIRRCHRGSLVRYCLRELQSRFDGVLLAAGLKSTVLFERNRCESGAMCPSGLFHLVSYRI
jgi:hypothetical protein